jgi:hypothetical protein
MPMAVVGVPPRLMGAAVEARKAGRFVSNASSLVISRMVRTLVPLIRRDSAYHCFVSYQNAVPQDPLQGPEPIAPEDRHGEDVGELQAEEGVSVVEGRSRTECCRLLGSFLRVGNISQRLSGTLSHCTILILSAETGYLYHPNDTLSSRKIDSASRQLSHRYEDISSSVLFALCELPGGMTSLPCGMLCCNPLVFGVLRRPIPCDIPLLLRRDHILLLAGVPTMLEPRRSLPTIRLVIGCTTQEGDLCNGCRFACSDLRARS